MNAKPVKREKVICTNCGYTMHLNAWGIPNKHQDDDYMDAITRAHKKLEKEIGFGIKEKNETR